ncbi:MAG: endopeptidase La [Deltaproteobacteria bacterium]|nr:endopeptidase La [Deltaproteobacteria bacterium]
MSEDEKNEFENEMEKDDSGSDGEKDHSTSDAEQDKPSAGTATVPEDGLVIAASELPDLIPVIPIRPRPAFPNLFIPITITGKGRINALKRALNTPHRALGLILARNPEAEDSVDNFCRVGVGGTVVKIIQVDEDTANFLFNCQERFSVRNIVQTRGIFFAQVEYHPAPELPPSRELKAYSMAIIAALKELVQINPLYSEEIKTFLTRSSMGDPGKLADFAANLTTVEGAELQQLLETFDVRKRVDRVLVLLKKELDISRLQSKIAKKIEEKMSQQQREFFLREQLKGIKKELGLEKEGKESDVEKFEERLKKLTLNEEAEKAVREELEKLSLMESSSAEYVVSRNYLDWLTCLPWGKYSKDSYHLDRARKILDRDHYGLDDVKERILEFIAVGKMKGDISGSILCLVGPPGVGKTSVGRSIASALNRSFYRFSLGGMRDEAEIKGHRRTYIGALPGRFIQAIKVAGTSNPVIMLDEIDKIGASYQGDPASALLEVLDPEQNSSFRDHYLDVPFDLSHVLFIATANQLDTIPAPLLDRMEVIRLAGYILEEKVEIAKRYLVPKNLTAHGLKRGQVSLKADTLTAIINDYAREAGVRGLENRIKKIMRRAAMKIAKGEATKVVPQCKDLQEYLGKPEFVEDEVFTGALGVATGLAWTSLGGATLQIEATSTPSKTKGFKQTGQLGAVMVESSEIAYNYVNTHLKENGVKEDYFDTHFIHLHVPAGATPKDGPSAGVTMATALISLIRGIPVREKLGMTGELTLTGKVFPIGGLKEKTIAARRVGLKTLIFPEGNRKDFEELPDYLKEGLEVHFAKEYEDVRRIAFPENTGGENGETSSAS